MLPPLARWLVLIGLTAEFGVVCEANAASPAPVGASSCTGCHSSSQDASIVPRLDGRPAQATIAAMQAFKSGKAPATVMDRIARGFSDAEIEAIANWFGQRK